MACERPTRWNEQASTDIVSCESTSRQQSLAVTGSASSAAHPGRETPASTSRSAAADASLPARPSATAATASSIASASVVARASNAGMNPPTSASSNASPALAPIDTNAAPMTSASNGSSNSTTSAAAAISSSISCCGSKDPPEHAGQSHSSGRPNTAGGMDRRVDRLLGLFRSPLRPRLMGLIREVCPTQGTAWRTPKGVSATSA